MVSGDLCSGTCHKRDHEEFCSFYRIFPLSPEIVCLNLVCLCIAAKETHVELLVFPLPD